MYSYLIHLSEMEDYVILTFASSSCAIALIFLFPFQPFPYPSLFPFPFLFLFPFRALFPSLLLLTPMTAVLQNYV